MNKKVKITIILLLIIIIACFITLIYMKYNKISNQEKIFTADIGNTDTNSIWCGTFQLAWNKLKNEIIKDDIVFENEDVPLANELNKELFTEEMLSSEDYYVVAGQTTERLKNKIIKEINSKFKTANLSLLDKIDFKDDLASVTLYSMLYKKFEFIEPFDRISNESFNNSVERFKYFGMQSTNYKDYSKVIEVLFYNSQDDFAVKLKTRENEDVILYCNNDNNTFSELYNDIKEKSNAYEGETKFSLSDSIEIPYIKVDTIINYGELCGKNIKSVSWAYIANAVQNIKFELNENGGNLTSEASIKAEFISAKKIERKFHFDKSFVVFLKETDKDMPYFALRVNNTDVLINDT